MSRNHVEMGRAFVAAVNAGDVEEALSLCHPEIVFEPQRAATEGAFIGRDGIRAFLRDTYETFETFNVDEVEFRDVGGRLLAIGSIRIRGHASGVETTIPMAAVAHFRDGLMSRYTDYGDARSALEAEDLGELDS